jgi:hypothetical protein
MKAEQQIDRVPTYLRSAGPIDEGNLRDVTISRVVGCPNGQGLT